MVFKLGECHYWSEPSNHAIDATIDTSISLTRHSEPTKEVVRLYELLHEYAIANEENVCCRDGCFVVESFSSRYQLRFVLEGCGKVPQWTGWMENGVPRIEPLHRMGIYRTRAALSRLGEGEEDHARSRLYFDELFKTRGELRNPADRFVDSCKISQWLAKHNLDIIYGRHPNRSHNQFVFSVEDEPDLRWDSWKTSSFFTMYDDNAAPLLAVFESVIPYYYEYYYDKFHFRKEEAEQILERIKQVRLQIINDPFDLSLGNITQRLLGSNFAWQYPDGRKPTRYGEEEKCEILSQNRFRVVALLDFFSWWLTQQRDNPRKRFDGFYVEGP